MYCSNCGKEIDNNADFCIGCGCRVQKTGDGKDKSSPLLGFLSFFVPIAGLFLYIFLEGNHPRKAKSAGKGAIAGVVTHVILGIIAICLYIGGIGFLIFSEVGQSKEKILKKYADVTIGEFIRESDGFYGEGEFSLPVTVKNKSDSKATFYITIEAVDQGGVRLGTDDIDVESLKGGQSAHLEAFDDLTPAEAREYRKADFEITEITMSRF